MTLTTPRYVLRYPQAADADNVPADMLNLATDIDNKFSGYSSGLLSARPAAAISGRRYRATDTGYTYLDIGTAWVSDGRPQADAAQTVLLYNAAWPASPLDGQEVDRYSDTTKASIWRFRYDSAQAVGEKWVFVGGAPLLVNFFAPGTVGTSATYGGSSWQSSGAQFTPGIVGLYDFFFRWSYGGTLFGSIQSGSVFATMSTGGAPGSSIPTSHAEESITCDTGMQTMATSCPVRIGPLTAASVYTAYMNARFAGGASTLALGFGVWPARLG